MVAVNIDIAQIVFVNCIYLFKLREMFIIF